MWNSQQNTVQSLTITFFFSVQFKQTISGIWYLCIMYFHTQLSATLLTPPRAPPVIPSYSEEPINPYLLRQKGLMQRAAWPPTKAHQPYRLALQGAGLLEWSGHPTLTAGAQKRKQTGIFSAQNSSAKEKKKKRKTKKKGMKDLKGEDS